MISEVQKNYMLAMDKLQTYEEVEAGFEKEYIINNKIINKDGPPLKGFIVLMIWMYSKKLTWKPQKLSGIVD